MSQRCTEVESLIDKRASGLDEAEGLVLEQHLVQCESCRQSAAFMRAIHRIVEDVPVELTERSRRRAITGAFDSVARAEVQERQRRRLLWPVSLGVTAAAAAALLMFWPASTAPVASTVAERVAKPSPSQPRSVDANAAVAHKDEWSAVARAEMRTYAHAKVDLVAGTRVRFDESAATLEIDSGEVVVDVDASKGRPFRVQTNHFRVEVLGTRFIVSPERVEVVHGRVQVFDLAGHVLARELSAGTSFSYESVESRAAKTRRAQPPAPQAQPGSRRAQETEARQDPAEAALPAATWLSRAREALSQGDPRAARAFILRAEESEPVRHDRAEAGTLRAECALIDRDIDAAVRFYTSVADRYGDLSAGENAAFAAAQISARSQGKERARALFERYLARYPKGRFADEARARLNAH